VLELEAAVQDDPTSHQAWYALGLKQQENERDDAAILALSKVVQLAPEYRAAYLALAVSFTNESAHKAANTMLERWLDIGEGKHVGAVRSSQDEENWAEGQKKLVNRLIDVARRNPEDVDADTQVALGVLFNTSEEYDKAEDCFMAALSARPDVSQPVALPECRSSWQDWLLYNRLGATLANSGRSNEAIEYYHKALSLHPNFVRALWVLGSLPIRRRRLALTPDARFNLGISHANLGQYPLAAQRILDALHLQHADATEGYVTGKAGSIKGITSDTLWNTLRTACIQ
jgi:peroxin-5